jgi:hypothetical protein
MIYSAVWTRRGDDEKGKMERRRSEVAITKR